MSKILIVDDHPTNRELLVTLLGYKGHILLEAVDGEVGLEVAKAERPDLIITDIVMPKMDGYEFARQVRNNPLIRDTQIIFYTSSYIISETRLLAEACGVSIIIGKPIEPQELLEQVEAALDLAPETAPIPPPISEEFHREHMRVLTDKLVDKVNELEAEIIQRKQAEEKNIQLNRLYATLSQVNQTIVHVKTTDELYQSICDVALQYGGFVLASIGILDESTGDIKPVAVGGADLENWPFEIVNINRGPFAKGLMATAIRTSTVILSEDLQTDERVQSVRNQIQSLAYHSSAAIPINLRGKTIGVFNLVSNEVGFFKAAQEVRLLEEMGLDISFALETIQTEAERKAAETARDQLANIVNASEDAIIGKTLDGIITSWNQGAEKLYGYRSDEVIGKSIAIIIPPERPNELPAILERIKQGEHVEHYESMRLKKDGSRIHISIAVSPIKDSNNQVIGASAIARDITERKQVEKALHESEGRLRQVWEATSDAMSLSDANGIVLSVNPAAIRLYGYPAEKIIGQSFAITLPEKDREQAIEGYKALFSSEMIPPTFESTVIRADGAERITESSLTFLTDANGQRVTMLSTFHDITDRKQSEEALLASEKRFRGLFEDSPISIWEEDFSLVKQRIDELREEGVDDFRAYFSEHIEDVIECAFRVKITDVNKAALHMYQADSAEQMLGSLRDVITANSMTSFLEELVTIAEGRTSFQWEGIDQTLLGRTIEVNLNWSVSPGHENNYSKVIVSTIDISGRKQAEEQIRKQLERLQALRTIDNAISSSFNLKLTLEVLLSQVVALLNVDAAVVLIFLPITKALEYAASRGFRSNATRQVKLGLADGLAGKAVLERQTIHVPNLQETTMPAKQALLLHDENFVDYYCTPLIVKGEVKGVLEILHRSVLAETTEWLDFLETLAGQAAIAIENSQLFAGLQRSNMELSLAYDATIEGWSRALDLRDKETEGHSQRVTDLTLKLAQEMGMGEADLVNVRRGALLHDIGKMGVPDNILLKPGKLTGTEWKIMRQHPGFAYEMLSGIDYLKPALDIPYCHHEKWDGSGYPRELKGEEIPLSARIFAIVDVWDALRSDRPYREGWTQEKVLAHINSESGKHFDPRVVEAFLNLIAAAQD